MRLIFGMILGAIFLTLAVYISDTSGTSAPSVEGQIAAPHRTIVNWDVAAENWDALKLRARQSWARLSSSE